MAVAATPFVNTGPALQQAESFMPRVDHVAERACNAAGRINWIAHPSPVGPIQIVFEQEGNGELSEQGDLDDWPVRSPRKNRAGCRHTGEGSHRGGIAKRDLVRREVRPHGIAKPLCGSLGSPRRRLLCQWPSVSRHWRPRNSPLVAIVSPRWWPSDLPTGGHRISPPGMRSGQVRGVTPLPAVACASR